MKSRLTFAFVTAALAVVIVVAGLLTGEAQKTAPKARTLRAAAVSVAPGGKDYDPTAAARAEIAKLKVGKGDWPMWMGWSHKNNTPLGVNIPTTWDVKTGLNIKWKAPLGSQSYGNPVVANGKVYVGTNNNHGYLKRYPPKVDLGCLLCFDEKTGKFLWQHSSPKIPAGRVNDWLEQGICCAPYVEGNRLWFVSSRGEVICLDTEGFRDGKNDGPFKGEAVVAPDEADVVWKFDMMGQLGIFQHNMCACSVMVVGDTVFVNTSNGVDADHVTLPSPNAPSFFAMDKTTGKILWTDKSPGRNILHGQWSSPTHAVIKGQPMVFFAGGDGWVRAFDPKGQKKKDKDGKEYTVSKLLWKFDCNPKTTKWILGGRGTRNNVIATPVVYKDRLYVAVGQDPEHGQGPGHLWCIDPGKKMDGSDVSPTLAVDKSGKVIPHRRLQAVDVAAGEKEIENPNSAKIWHYGAMTDDEYEKTPFEKAMHRSCGTVAIKNDILFIADFSGLVHCLDANTGKAHWTYDLFAASWSSPLIVDGKVYIADEEGDIAIFPLTADPMKAAKIVAGGKQPALGEINMGAPVETSPIVANNVLFIASRRFLYAISKGGK
jgi:outer membrane protein assembly factor BamB